VNTAPARSLVMDRRAVALLAAGHLCTDLNQGAMPALLPFFVAARGLSYAQAAGLILAATVGSSIVQPIFGQYADQFSAAWLMPVGILLAGVGLALTGVAGQYWMMAGVLVLSGLGVAAFHPEAARSMNAAAGARKATGMSFFSVGGSAGFTLGPLLATGVAVAFGVRGTLLLALPAVIMAAVLAFQLGKLPRPSVARPQTAAAGGQREEWRHFSRLSVAVVVRSVVFVGMNTFLPLYWVNRLHQPPGSGGLVLSLLLACSLLGSLMGGWLADRYSFRRLGLLTSLALVPLLLLFVRIENSWLAALLLLPIGFLFQAPSSGLIVFAQELLPSHIGVASGVTIGLSVSAGGMVAPLLGWLADHFGLESALASLAVLPLLVAAVIWTLPRQATQP
jgi:FSR family fosmidomycin resistance protein-like MFS transporter